MILGYRGWIRFKQGRIEEGIKDYSMAAELGDAYSQFQHGQQLFYGVPPSLTPNRNQGLLWITKAAEQGDEAAKQFLKQVGEKQ
jgi:TPR repeat protein